MLQRLATMLAVAAGAAQAISRIHVNSNTRMLENEDGETVVLHGVNVVYKVPPYIPSDGEFDPNLSLNDYDIQKLQEWGMNFVRLGVMWEGVEQERGVYNDDYLDQITTLINKLGDAGIYTLVDAHQDVFARYLCGEGVPDFYAQDVLKRPVCHSRLLDPIVKPILNKFGICRSIQKDYGFSFDENNDPLITDCQKHNFASYYPSLESINAFDALYNNVQGLQDKFVASWARVAKQFANNPAVLGFDPLNEPYPGNNIKDLTLNKPGKTDRVALAPMYERIYEAWKAENPESIMYFEGTQFPDTYGIMNGFVFPTGFQTPPGGEIGSNKHVFNDHTYCCQMNPAACATGEPTPEWADRCLAWHQKRLATRVADAERLGVPLFISEFGACLDSESCATEITQVASTCDEYLVGWAYWEYKPFGDLTTSAGTGSEGFYNNDGTLQDKKVKALARPYFMNTQGTPVSMSFNNNVFQGTYIANSSEQFPNASTVVYTSDLWFPNGSCTQVTEMSTGNDVTQSNGIELSVDASGVEGSSKRINIKVSEANTYKVIVTPKNTKVCPGGQFDSTASTA